MSRCLFCPFCLYHHSSLQFSILQDRRECLLRAVICTKGLIASFHVQIAGTIGTGLFLGSGSALQGAGPLGALLAYLLVGTVAYSYVHRRDIPWESSLTMEQITVFYR